MNDKMISKLSAVKRLGASRSGAHTHSVQRLTAWLMLLLLPIISYVVLRVSSDITSVNDMDVITLLANPFTMLAYLFFIASSLYHGAIGMQIIIEDYVHDETLKSILVNLVKMISIVTFVAGVLGGLVIHIIVVTSF